MFEAATGEGGERRQLQREQTQSGRSKAFVQNGRITAEKVWVLNPLTGKSVSVKTHTSPTGATTLVEMKLAVTG